jgi:P27 family predicted phage terminase small subunit
VWRNYGLIKAEAEVGGNGSGGKNKKSTAQKKAEGNRGKRALNLHELKELPGEPKMPSFMNQAARKLWPEVVIMLARAGVLFETDGVAIGAFCSSLALFKQMDAAIAKYGSINVELDEVTGTGVLRTSSAVRVRSDALKQVRASWQSFGLDPASRIGIQSGEPPEKTLSALDNILRSKSAGDDIVN